MGRRSYSDIYGARLEGYFTGTQLIMDQAHYIISEMGRVPERWPAHIRESGAYEVIKNSNRAPRRAHRAH